MGCCWEIDGTVTTKSREQAEEILKALEDLFQRRTSACDVAADDDDDKIVTFWCSCSWRNELPNEIAGVLSKADGVAVGEFRADSEKGDHCIYRFTDGAFAKIDGENYIYFPGQEDDFVEQLPEAVIDRIKASEPVISDAADSLASVSSSTLVHELHRRIAQGDDDYIAMSVWMKDDVQIRIDAADENPYAISADDVIKTGFLKELGAATDHDWDIIQDAIRKTREQKRRRIRESAENANIWSDPDGVYANIDISEDRYVTVKMPVPISRESDGAPYAYVMQAENGREVMAKGTGNGVCSLKEAGLSEGELVDTVRDKLFVRADRIMWQKQKNDHTDSE